MASGETIQQFLDSGDRYEIWCDNQECRHHAHIDMAALRDRLGPDHGALRDDIIHLFRCSACGGKRLGLIRQARGNDEKGTAGAYNYMNQYAKAKGV